MSINNCPCGQDKTYANCCQIIHLDSSKATTAEQLMRSRFVAFTKGMGDYLLASHHSSTRPVDQMPQIVKWANSVDWLNLEILETTNGKMGDVSGTVKFKANFVQAKKPDFILENSQFVKENGCWVYLGFAEEKK